MSSFLVQTVLSPLVLTHVASWMFCCICRNIAVSVDLAIVGKLAQTVFSRRRFLQLPRPQRWTVISRRAVSGIFLLRPTCLGLSVLSSELHRSCSYSNSLDVFPGHPPWASSTRLVALFSVASRQSHRTFLPTSTPRRFYMAKQPPLRPQFQVETVAFTLWSILITGMIIIG
jgi:hypothetical protein